MASSSNSWMPRVGRYSVDVGSSLGRTLKARYNKDDAPPPAPSGKRAIPTREFFSFRYNFQPPSIDSNTRGNIEIQRNDDIAMGKMQRASTQPGEGHQFEVREQQPKEYDCVVIFDEETMTFTLEKLDSQIHLTYEHKISLPSTPPPANPTPPPPVHSKQVVVDHNQALEAELERELLSADDDAYGDIDDDLEEILPTSNTPREEDVEEIYIPPLPSPPKPDVARPAKSTVPLPGKPRQPARSAPAPAPAPAPPPPKPKAKPVPVPRAKKAKRDPEPSTSSHTLVSADEEDLQFGRPTKRPRPSPPSEGLALPGASTPIYTPPPPISVSSSAAAVHRARPTVPSPLAPMSESDEEEWDEVVDVTKDDDDVQDDFDVFGDEVGGGEEIDVNAFEQELNEQMEMSDEDFLAEAVSPEPEDEPARVPISLNQLARGANGVAGYASEDEYSSSDESDDD